MQKQTIEHLELWKKFQKEKNKRKKEKLRTKLVELYYPLVQKISYKVAERIKWKLLPEELSSFGVDGLYVAIERFSVNEGVDFPGYAYRRIGGSMIDGIRKEDMIPRSVRINNSMMDKIKIEIEAEKGQKASEYEIIEKLGVNQTEYLKNIKKYKPLNFVSLDGSSICNSNKQEDFQQDLLTDLTDRKTSSPDDEILKHEFLSKLISKGFSRLEQKIVFFYYYKKHTMEEIAGRLNMSESRISQIHTNILPRLKNKIERNPDFFKEDLLKYSKSEK